MKKMKVRALSAVVVAMSGPLALEASAAQGLSSSGVSAIPTFEAIGVYYTPGGNPGSAGCQIQYKKASDTAYRPALAMWYDSRNGECRGSVVRLSPGTSYDIQVGVGGVFSRGVTTQTWNESFPVARTVYVSSGSQTLNITSGGSAGAYVLYTPAPGTSATIDVANAQAYNVNITAPYVIVRGLTLKGAQRDGIHLNDAAHDVVIENNDISGWGRTTGLPTSAGYLRGVDMDSGIHGVCSTAGMARAVIQRNKIHDPRYGANSWTDGHPAGPQGISFDSCGTNHVIRYNEIYSTPGKTTGHYFNDGIGGSENFSITGFPNADADIYGNRIENTWDDCIEAEGGDRNVRIWGNYCNNTATAVATTVASVGPVYIFRNVYNRSRMLEGNTLDQDQRNVAFKSGSNASLGDGRRYILHNTLLQATQSGVVNGLGAGAGVGGTGSDQLVNNTVSRNNIYQMWKTGGATYQMGVNNDFDYDLYNNTGGAVSEVHGMSGVPTYAAGNGPTSEAGGMYQLASGTAGYDKGVFIANFNDDFTGTAPDLGAQESGAAAMVFGVKGGTTTVPAPSPSPSPTVTSTPAPSPSPSPTSVAVSAAGTSVPPATQIVDKQFNKWTLSGGVVYVNGALAGYSANVVRLYWNGTSVFQNNSAGGWWSWNGTDWVDATDPTCAHAAPSVSLVPSSTAGSAPGATQNYSVLVQNKDSAACHAATFSLSATVPSGLSASLGSSTLTLIPGGSGSTSLGVTSALTVAPGSYSVSVKAVSSFGSTYAGSGSSTYSVVLVKSAAGTSIPPAAQIIDGNLSRWTVSGGVIYKDGVTAGYSANVTQLYFDGTSIYQTASQGGWWVWNGTDWADATSPICTRANPTVRLTTLNGAQVVAGTSINYAVSVTNNDSSRCGTSAFGLSASVPSGWSRSLGASSLSIAPGASASTTLAVTSSSTTTTGVYTVGVSAVNGSSTGYGASATASYSALAAFTTSVGVSSTTISRGSTETIQAAVRLAGAPVSGASVLFTVLRPDGKSGTTTVITNSSGVAAITYTIGSTYPLGTYRVTAQGSSGGRTSTASASFTAQ